MNLSHPDSPDVIQAPRNPLPSLRSPNHLPRAHRPVVAHHRPKHHPRIPRLPRRTGQPHRRPPSRTRGEIVNATEDGEPLGEAPELPGRGHKVYITGPMTGLPEFNYPAFHAKAAELRAQGFEVYNPAENDSGSSGKPWEFYMRLALKQLLECDEIHLLPGWHNSRGARIEKKLAEELGMTIHGALQ